MELQFVRTTKEHDELVSDHVCGFPTDSLDKYGGLLKVGGHWINIHWLEKVSFRCCSKNVCCCPCC